MLLVVTSLASAEAVVHPKVVTSASVDCSSLESIVRDVVKPGMSDQEKLLALYHWFRRTIYHYRMMGADRRDVLRLINSYGSALCGSQAAVFRQLCNAAGLKARVVSGDGGNELGHTFVEVWYGGSWHAIDTMTSFYVLTRDARPVIASMADLSADPTLVTKAQQEGRCGPEFLYCLRRREVDYALRQKMVADGMREDIAWTLFVIAPDENGNPRDIRTFWLKGPKHPSYMDPEEAYNARYEPGLLDITLKPNEEYVRLWDNIGRWMTNGNFETAGPYHTCGRSDECDPVNFKFYEPYRKADVGYAKCAYRYFANGWLDWQPKQDQILLGSTHSNLSFDRRSGVFKVIDAGKPSSLVIPVTTPYAIVEAALDLDITGPAAHSAITVTCQPADDDYNRGVRPQSRTFKIKPGIVRAAFDVGGRKDVSGGVFGYNFIVEVTGGNPAFSVRRVKTTFMLNMYSLPYFAPGRNNVTISAARQGVLKDAKLVVNYEWADAPEWKALRSDTRVITSFPSSYMVNVGGTKMPRMKRLVMKVVPGDRRAATF